jgi:hypothetical protein
MKSPQALIVMAIGIVMAILGWRKYELKLIVIQLISYYFFASTIECKIYGGCILSSWISVIFPVSIFLLFILDHLDLFKPQRKKMRKSLVQIIKIFK